MEEVYIDLRRSMMNTKVPKSWITNSRHVPGQLGQENIAERNRLDVLEFKLNEVKRVSQPVQELSITELKSEVKATLDELDKCKYKVIPSFSGSYFTQGRLSI